MSYDLERERREAIEAGESALNRLYQAKRDLSSAQGWGLIDIFGGGFLTTAIKRSKINDAGRNIDMARSELRRFSKELRDFSTITGTDFDIGGFAVFADYFFDGMLADFYVQSKINKARNQVEEAINRVEDVLNRIR